MLEQQLDRSGLMTASLAVRPPAGSAEIAAFFRLAAATFARDAPVEVAADDWRRFLLDAPAADGRRLRGAFRDDAYLGGYVIEERWLRVGAARVQTGCIGAVVVHPDHRGQGVATALMRDAFAFARARAHRLLLLHGLANFYDPFGFVDVFDATEHAVEVSRVLALPASPYHVRPATVAGAPALLDLYRRHYGPYPGSFDRTPEEQAFRLRFAASLDRRQDDRPFDVPVLAEDDAGRPRGYLVAPWGPLRAFGGEVAADDWSALLALLQHQARLLAVLPDQPAEVCWPLPPDSATFFLLADHLPVRSRSLHRPRAGWMACPVDLPGFVRSLLPAWEERWRRANPGWTGDLALTIGEHAWMLELGRDAVGLTERPTDHVRSIRLSPQRFTQVVFGFRSAAWAAAQDGSEVPADLLPVLDALFPPRRPWIPPTDGC